MKIGGLEVNQAQLELILDWCRDKFPVKDEWSGDSLFIYFPFHTESKGFVEIIPNPDKLQWTIIADIEFAEEIKAVL